MQLETGAWDEELDRLEEVARAPSEEGWLARRWERISKTPAVLERLVQLEARYGCPILALDIAEWAMELGGDAALLRVSAALAAADANLPELARVFLRTTIHAVGEDSPHATAIERAAYRIALRRGRIADLKRAGILRPSEPTAAVRLGDDCWKAHDNERALQSYRWAICCGASNAKIYVRFVQGNSKSPGVEARIEMVQALFARTGDPRLKPLIMTMLVDRGRRMEALEVIGDAPSTWATTERTSTVIRSLVAFARAQLIASTETDQRLGLAPSDGLSSLERHHRVGRALMRAGWHGPAAWHLRRAVDQLQDR
ncbi:MAG: hypothetical protein HQ481_05840 [Alphaproteobacteria bacterium]|nr:hypothetical protein [Alphaproteobacteria bacterium]